MLKAALLCSAVCTAFVVGGHSSTPSQDKPAEAVKPVALCKVLRLLEGDKCKVERHGDYWILNFHSGAKGKKHRLNTVGLDFVSLTDRDSTGYFPISSISAIFFDPK